MLSHRLLAWLALFAALPAFAQYGLPDEPKTEEEKAFYSVVVKSIFAVMPGEREKFGLTYAERHPPTFPGRELNSLEQVACEKIAAFGFLGFGTELGHLSAAVCSNGASVRTLSMRARANLSGLAKRLGGTEADFRKAGWYYEQQALADGAEFYYFPVLLVSHGILGPLTAVLYEKKSGKAVVVQIEVRQMCGENFLRDFKDAPFCTDMPATLKRLVLSLRGTL
jgi:hypothetical protein